AGHGGAPVRVEAQAGGLVVARPTEERGEREGVARRGQPGDEGVDGAVERGVEGAGGGGEVGAGGAAGHGDVARRAERDGADLVPPRAAEERGVFERVAGGGEPGDEGVHDAAEGGAVGPGGR